jgi:DNA-binding SARP family transcriptional activator
MVAPGKEPAIDFRILGPLEVWDGDRPLPLGGAKQRALLALLLLRANEVLSRDRLIDELWGEQPPETATTALQVHVSQLRKALAAAGGDPRRRLATRPGGYVLTLAPDELDATRFEGLLAEARECLARGDAAEAAASLREALALWRGPALADFAYEPFAQAEIARLEELRLACLEERIEADLALARQADLVGELEALVVQQPLRERLRGQLMLALYRSGRQGEALEAYQAARRVLIDELGIEASPALQRLEKAILVQDDSLELPDQARPAAIAEPGPAPTKEEPIAPPAETRKIVTVVFTNVADSTALAAALDPERLRRVMTRYVETVSEVFVRHGGTVEKFIGDAVTAVFGIPTVHEDDVLRALRAVLELRDAVVTLNDELTRDWGVRIAARTGVNTGEVVTGDPSSGQTLVTGEPVNLAARLERSARPGEVLVGERTAAAARGAFEFSPLARQAAKGKAEGIVGQRLLRALSFERPRGVAGREAPFVGREPELELLEAAYQRAVRARELHLVTVLGDAGIGKTRLAAELRDRMRAGSPEPVFRTGRCLSYGRGVTYWPLGEILKEHLGLLESDPEESVRERLGGRDILALTLGLESSLDLHPLVARERLHDAWVELFEEFVAERPAVVLIEDLHWAEEALLDLLERLLREVRGPLLLVTTTRPELLGRRPAWGGGHRNATSLSLEPLLSEEGATMLAGILGVELPSTLRDTFLERAEGNPFFLEELLASLVDRGVLERSQTGWTVRGPDADFAVPDSVHAVLAARIDLLEPVEKAALQAAAVIGRVFWAGPVSELLGGAEPDFRVLEERDFVRRLPRAGIRGEREFSFKHMLTREVAYASLPRAARARLHAGFATWLEEFGEGRDEHAPLLGHHYAEAVRPDDVDLAWGDDPGEAERLQAKAVLWLRRAAALAFARYALDEEVGLLQRAVELGVDPEERAQLYQLIGRAHARRYDQPAFRKAMLAAIDSGPREETAAELYSELAFQTAFRWGHAEDAKLVETWIDAALTRAPLASGARARALTARSYSRPETAAPAAAEANQIAQQLPDVELRSYALRAEADAALAEGRYHDARTLAERRMALLDEISDPDHVADVYWSGIPGYVAEGFFEEARRYAALHDDATNELTPHHQLHGVAFLLEVEELAASWETIRNLTPRVEAAVTDNAATPCVHNPRSLLVSALAHACLGDEQEAARLEELADSLGIEEYGRVFDTRIRLALLRHDRDAVKRLLRASERPRKSLIRSTKFAPAAARLDALAALGVGERVEVEAQQFLRPGTYLEPFALRALGTVRGDGSLIDDAVAKFEAMGLAWYADETRSRPARTPRRTSGSNPGARRVHGKSGQR